MFFTKSKPTQNASLRSLSLLQSPQNRVWREVWRILWLAFAAHLLVALLSFSPKDPSWSTWSSQSHFQNWMGRIGSIEADLLIQLFGLASFTITFLILFFTFRPHSEMPDKKGSKKSLLIHLAFLCSLCSVIQAFSPKGWTPLHIAQPGGLLGSLMNSGLLYFSGRGGMVSISLVLLICSSIVLFDWPLLSSFCRKSVAFLKFLPPWITGKWVSFRKNRPWVKNDICSHLKVSLALEPQEVKPLLLREVEPPPSCEPPIEPSLLTRKEDENESFSLFSFSKPLRKKNPGLPKQPVDPNREFELPPVSLLSKAAPNTTKPFDKNWYFEKSKNIVEKLNDFGVEGEIVNISPGPVITVYEFKPASGVKIKEIANLSDDLTLALSVLSVRIVAPIPGKPVIGIEIPSLERQTVYFRELMEELPFYDKNIKIPVLIGRLASGDPVVADLSSMPHLLVAGATGTGKSVFINSLISSLLFRFTARELKLILVDPKMVELSQYEDIPHLLLPVVVDSKMAAQALRWAVSEMERRYRLMHKAGVRHIDAYNEKFQGKDTVEEGFDQHLPFIVIVIDEYADLMAVVPKEVELSIARLAQKARASGIHLVLATQRPSTDVVTGTIKANFTSRISFRVASLVDSKTILDRSGAERLLGHGDMLLHSAGFTILKRMQGAYISDEDLKKVVEFLKSQGEPLYDEQILQMMEEDTCLPPDSEQEGGADELFDRAVRLVAEKGEASISLIQRSLRIGYNRAANLMDALEKEGIVAPSAPGSSSKRRAVLVDNL